MATSTAFVRGIGREVEAILADGCGAADGHATSRGGFVAKAAGGLAARFGLLAHPELCVADSRALCIALGAARAQRAAGCRAVVAIAYRVRAVGLQERQGCQEG